MREKHFYVSILGSLSGTWYIGMTNDIVKRVWQHKQHEFEGFTAEYDVDRLLYWESFDDVRNAINREKQLKGWVRRKKVALIEGDNPQWKDLRGDWYRDRGPSTHLVLRDAEDKARSG